jgi:hypothetical protein
MFETAEFVRHVALRQLHAWQSAFLPFLPSVAHYGNRFSRTVLVMIRHVQVGRICYIFGFTKEFVHALSQRCDLAPTRGISRISRADNASALCATRGDARGCTGARGLLSAPSAPCAGFYPQLHLQQNSRTIAFRSAWSSAKKRCARGVFR